MERWRARLNIAADAAEAEQPAGEEPEAAATEAAEQRAGGEEPGAAEYRFLGQQEQQQASDAQALAPATEEQAAAQQQQDGAEDEEGGGGDAAAAAAEEATEEESEPMDADQPAGEAQQQQLMAGAANWGAGGDRKAGLEAGEAGAAEEEAAQEAAEEAEQPGEDGEGNAGEAAARDALESYVAARLQQATLEDGVPVAEEVGGRRGLARAGRLRSCICKAASWRGPCCCSLSSSLPPWPARLHTCSGRWAG
jgi:hypothetical protein